MDDITGSNSKEIAEQLDCGLRAFIHKTSGQLLFVPDDQNFSAIDIELWQKDLDLLKNNPSDYHEIEKWTSSQGFEMMQQFADQLTNKELQRRLINALNKKKPFREFKFIIDNSGDVRKQWFDFKNNWQQDFVTSQLNLIKENEE